MQMADNISNLADQARPVVRDLLQADEGQLYELLATSKLAVLNDPKTAGSIEPQATARDVTTQGLDIDLLNTGKGIFDKLSPAAYQVVCGDDNGDLSDAFKAGKEVAATALAAILVAQLLWIPAIATIIAAIIVKLFFDTAFQVVCNAWKGALPAQAPKPVTPS